MSRALCRLDDIADPGAKGFVFGDGAAREEIFVVRQGGAVYGYVNSCPHQGTPLEFLDDRFLTADKTLILCSTHGARFAIATGDCVAGPCAGRSLRRVRVEIENGAVALTD